MDLGADSLLQKKRSVNLKTELETETLRRKKNLKKYNLIDLWNSIKQTYIYVTGVPNRGRKRRRKQYLKKECLKYFQIR